jgi:hypothetical protein
MEAWSQEEPATPTTPRHLRERLVTPLPLEPLLQQQINASTVTRLHDTLSRLDARIKEYEALYQQASVIPDSEAGPAEPKVEISSLHESLLSQRADLQSEIDKLTFENRQLSIPRDTIVDAQLDHEHLTHLTIQYSEHINRLEEHLSIRQDTPQRPAAPSQRRLSSTSTGDLARTTPLIALLGNAIFKLQARLIEIEKALIAGTPPLITQLHQNNQQLRKRLEWLKEENNRLLPIFTNYTHLNEANKTLKDRVLHQAITYDQLADFYDAEQKKTDLFYVPQPRLNINDFIQGIQPVHQQQREREEAARRQKCCGWTCIVI